MITSLANISLAANTEDYPWYLDGAAAYQRFDAKKAAELTNEHLMPKVFEVIDSNIDQGSCYIAYTASDYTQVKYIQKELKPLGYKTRTVKNADWIDISWCD